LPGTEINTRKFRERLAEKGVEQASRRWATTSLSSECELKRAECINEHTPKPISRLPPLPEPPTDPIAAEVFRTIEAQGRPILHVHRMSLHSPKFFRAQATYAGALRNDISLPRTLCELVIVRTAQLQNCPYVFSVHVRMAREFGVSDARLAALDKWEKSELFNKREKAALA
jgi:AhpD family alkylhydroperoxidase